MPNTVQIEIGAIKLASKCNLGQIPEIIVILLTRAPKRRIFCSSDDMVTTTMLYRHTAAL